MYLVGIVMSLFFNMLPRLVITFLQATVLSAPPDRIEAEMG